MRVPALRRCAVEVCSSVMDEMVAHGWRIMGSYLNEEDVE